MGSKQIPQQSISQQNHRTVEVCDICGDAGEADIILTCPRCKISREHSYCRKIFSSNYYDDWACDDCIGERSVSYKVNQGQGRRISSVPEEMSTVQAVRKELIESIEPVATTAPAKTKDASLVRETSTQRNALSSPAPNQLYTGVSSVQPAVKTRLARKSKPASVPKEASCAPSLKKAITSGQRVNGELPPGVNNSELMSSEPEAEKRSRVPAKDLTWKGLFNICHDTFSNMTFQNEARPCSRTSRKVLECSKRMPYLLQFNLTRRGDVWELLFQDGCATINDIGLYFYSSNKGKDRFSSYGFILKFIEGQDLALRCVLSGLELYLFTSKRLPVDYQMLDGCRYLWGVFRKIKKHKDVAELYEGLPRTIHQPSSSSAPLQANIKKEPLDCPPGFEETRKLKIQKL